MQAIIQLKDNQPTLLRQAREALDAPDSQADHAATPSVTAHDRLENREALVTALAGLDFPGAVAVARITSRRQADDDGGEPFGWLVHDQEARIGDQSARDRQHLLFAAGELASAIVLALGEARECVVDALDRPRPTADARGHAQMLVDGERTPQTSPLRDVADAEPGDLRRLQRQQVLAAHADRTAGRAHQSHDRLAERGLAHAVAADNGKHAGVEGQVDALQRVRAAVIDVEASDLEDRGGAAGISHARLRDKAPGLRDRTRFPAAALP